MHSVMAKFQGGTYFFISHPDYTTAASWAKAFKRYFGKAEFFVVDINPSAFSEDRGSKLFCKLYWNNMKEISLHPTEWRSERNGPTQEETYAPTSGRGSRRRR